MKLRHVFLAIFVTFAWGSYFTASKIALISFPPFFFAASRFFLLFLITSPFLFKDKLPIKTVFCFSIIILLNMLALNQAINLCISLSPIILINELAVPISTLLGVFFFKEKFALKDALGITIAFIGLAIVIQMRSKEQVCSAAVVFTILASLLFAGYNLMAKKLSCFNILAVISLSSLFIFPIFLTLSFFQENWPAPEEIQLQSILALLYIVMACSLAGHFIWMYLLNKYPMSKVVPFTLLSPVFGCLITIIALNEKIEDSILWGGSLVMVGLIIIELNKNYAEKK